MLFAMIPGIFAGAPTEDTYVSLYRSRGTGALVGLAGEVVLMGNPPFHGNPQLCYMGCPTGESQGENPGDQVVGKQGVQHDSTY